MYWNERTRQGMSGNYFLTKWLFLKETEFSKAMPSIDHFPEGVFFFTLFVFNSEK